MSEAKPRGNLFEFPENLPEGEFSENLIKAPGVRLERILSRGDVTPPGKWYDQEENEWVVLLRGEAVIEYEDGEKIRLFRGDWVFIPAHVQHRVAWTSVDPPCVWLALKAMSQDMAGNMIFAGEAERTWLQELASAWSVRLCFRKSLGADMFARITISSDGDAWVEMLEGFDPEEYYRRWGNRDIEPPELFRFLLLHEIAHRELGHERQKILPGLRTRRDWQDAIKNREDETDQWARERLRNPWPNPEGTGRCLVGCSGWSYESWRGNYYPGDLKSVEWLSHYTRDFPTTEINMSFYRLPNEKIILSWAKRVPPRFVFAAKGSRRITHYKCLENCGEETKRFLRRMALLPQLSCILWQLPPSLEYDPSLLDNFCRLLPGHRRQSVEFRHPSWWENLDETADILSRYRIAFTGVSRKGLPDYAPLTADFSYFRFHGLGDSPYQWSYTREELKPWAKRIKNLSEKGVDVYAYFNNDADARAVENARDLAEMVAETP